MNGVRGSEGRRGKRGVQGEPGRPGRDGQPGLPGAKGEKGERGELGMAYTDNGTKCQCKHVILKMIPDLYIDKCKMFPCFSVSLNIYLCCTH